MPELLDWERRGYNDYPHNHLYPNRDKFDTITDFLNTEKIYLTGWYKRAREFALDNEIIRNHGWG